MSFRDFRDSGPLTVYFAQEVERSIAKYFQGRIDVLLNAGRSLEGRFPPTDAVYDACIQFAALPKVPLLLLMNDADAEFAAQCSVLFERRAEQYLDSECLAMTGRLLFTILKRASA